MNNKGFSLIEALISMALLGIVGTGMLWLYVRSVRVYDAEHRTASMNQELRGAMATMATEISQAGSHPPASMNLTQDVTASLNPQTVTVSSTNGLNIGDWVYVDTGANEEFVQIVDIYRASGKIKAIFEEAHNNLAPVNLFAYPFPGIMIPDSQPEPNGQMFQGSLSFFGDINGDGTLQYVEYVIEPDPLNAPLGRVTRSITPIDKAGNPKNPPQVLLRNLVRGRFEVYCDDLGGITMAGIEMTVQSTEKDKPQTTTQFMKVSAPSVAARSALMHKMIEDGVPNYLPPTPPQVIGWCARHCDGWLNWWLGVKGIDTTGGFGSDRLTILQIDQTNGNGFQVYGPNIGL